jgi:hypothetical protein
MDRGADQSSGKDGVLMIVSLYGMLTFGYSYQASPGA